MDAFVIFHESAQPGISISEHQSEVVGRFQDKACHQVYHLRFADEELLAELLIEWCRLPGVEATQTLFVLKTFRHATAPYGALLTVPGVKLDDALSLILREHRLVGVYLVAGKSDFVVSFREPEILDWLQGWFGSPDDLWVPPISQ